MITVGIDPGRTGALAVIDDSRLTTVADLDIRDGGRLACQQFRAQLLRVVPAGERGRVIVEALHARPGFDVTTQGELLRMAGAIEAVVRSLSWLEYHEIDPKKWKRFYGLKADKRASVQTAKALYPQVEGISLVKHNNRAEALLIAHYARRIMA